ncbi:MAG TPA: (2Fe-2S) ferredoxin domain-containing protein [bacterium]|jgi:(2Fe-2S) ferredoxin|nr:(2Fe-2S) ferredoxin domain-containing protein [bacterium]
MPKLTKDNLEAYAKKAAAHKVKDVIRVGMSTCGIAAGAEEVYEVLKNEVRQRNLGIEIQKCGCSGKCYAEPLVEVIVKDLPAVVYGKVDKTFALAIVDRHVINGELLNDHIFDVQEANGDEK